MRKLALSQLSGTLLYPSSPRSLLTMRFPRVVKTRLCLHFVSNDCQDQHAEMGIAPSAQL